MKSLASVAVWVLIGLASIPTAASDRPPERAEVGPSVSALREKLRHVFRDRLRAAVSLSDEQMASVSPVLERLEAERVSIRRERLEIIRDLRRGMRGGGSDAEIDATLGRLDELGIRQEEATRDALRE